MVHGGSVRLRKGLVVAQVALSLLLLIGAGLFLQSLRNLKYTNPGFDVREPALVRSRADLESLRQALDPRLLPSSFGPPEDRARDRVRDAGHDPGAAEQRMGQLGDHRGLHTQTGRVSRSAHAVLLARLFCGIEDSHPAGPRFHHQRCRGRAQGGHCQPEVRDTDISATRVRWAGTSAWGSIPAPRWTSKSSAWPATPSTKTCSDEIPYEFYIPYTQLDFVTRHDRLPARARRSRQHLQYDAPRGARSRSGACRCTICARSTINSKSRCSSNGCWPRSRASSAASGDAAGGAGPLRRDGVHGGAPHPGDRHPHGAGRRYAARWSGW